MEKNTAVENNIFRCPAVLIIKKKSLNATKTTSNMFQNRLFAYTR